MPHWGRPQPAQALPWTAGSSAGPSLGHMEPGVRQSPRHHITKSGQNVTLRCDPIPGHLYICWYRQTLGKGVEFLMSIYNREPPQNADFLTERFSAEMPDDTYLTLKIQPFLELRDSALYLCASSLAQPCWVTSLLCTNLPAPVRSNFRADRSVRAQKLQWERPPGPRAPMPFRQG
uniref:Ig-like domain-containing protein n=1 Tax=Sus scrofa TaxID=9823 RepID=A0A8D1GS69_PIG